MLESISKENFNQLLNRFSADELENLIEKFPYFQQAHVLLAKKYQESSHPKFDEQLQLAALYSQDRDFLFSLFNEQRNAASFEIPLEFLPKAEEPQETVMEADTPDSPSHDHEKQMTIDEKPIENVAVTEYSPSDAPYEYVEREKIIEDDSTPPQEEIVTEPEQIFLVTEPHSFDEWLQAYNKPENLEEAPKQEPDSPEPEKRIGLSEKPNDELEQLILSNLPLQELVEEETHFSKGLDKFIDEQKQKHKQQEIRMPSYEDDLAPELITETIAKVYEMQKKFARAIRAYEILALKYPEKNDFFAARINYLKNNI